VCSTILILFGSLVVHDAADIPVGGIKLKIGGKSGGQNGIKHIIDRLGTQEFPRLKLGIGRPEREGTDLATWVLSRFPSSESEKVDSMVSLAKDCLLTWLEHGVDKAMNDFNAEAGTKVKKTKSKKSAPQASSSAPSAFNPAESAPQNIVVQEG
jgi:PTH1 family peptidyl-tRNA hydrolase